MTSDRAPWDLLPYQPRAMKFVTTDAKSWAVIAIFGPIELPQPV